MISHWREANLEVSLIQHSRGRWRRGTPKALLSDVDNWLLWRHSTKRRSNQIRRYVDTLCNLSLNSFLPLRSIDFVIRSANNCFFYLGAWKPVYMKSTRYYLNLKMTANAFHLIVEINYWSSIKGLWDIVRINRKYWSFYGMVLFLFVDLIFSKVYTT